MKELIRFAITFVGAGMGAIIGLELTPYAYTGEAPDHADAFGNMLIMAALWAGGGNILAVIFCDKEEEQPPSCEHEARGGTINPNMGEVA